MIKKTVFFFIALFLVGCNTTRPTIITTKSGAKKPKKEIAHTSKKTSKKGSKSAKGNSTETIESTSRTMVTNEVVNEYIAKFKGAAMYNMKQYGVPASIILAQGILESGAGKGDLAVSANNHFGIKCHNDWTGERTYHDDDSLQECFRKYNDASESFKDHVLFLTTRNRYAGLFSLPQGDYKAWAKGLREAGYATDIKYPEKLISYVERYNLHQYDAKVLGVKYIPFENSTVKIASSQNRDVTLYEVQKGDTLYSISKKFNLLVEDIVQKNSLLENKISVGQKLIVR